MKLLQQKMQIRLPAKREFSQRDAAWQELVGGGWYIYSMEELFNGLILHANN